MKSRKIIIVTAVITILLGSLCMGIGFAMGGSLNALRISFGFDSDGFEFSQHEDDRDKIKLDLDTVKTLIVDQQLGNVTITETDTDKIQVLNVMEDQYTLDIDKDQATLKLKNQGGFHIFNFGNSYTQDIEILVPKGFVFDRFEIYNSMGDIDLTNTQAKNLYIEANMGDIRGRNLKTEGMYIENDMGNIELAGVFLNESEIHNDMGDIEINVHDKLENYSYDADCSMGDVKVNHEKGRNSQVSSSAKNKMTIRDSMGDITMNFE